ncbi:MAG: tRNA 2-selenouridine(34) synthase MnmH [Gammaproteobacteria bacterium]|nr:tRNA 2-selenouridine(34) synthase MnmH [Gammaproteobacteria bacterium]MCW8986112.1 tRNA 2-selenouridine(34) synthase MnmH [Gammaproteobacteria bacterium]MCW9029863.1 tRNA 2-selenouridine(34) synthase MnmH [Gammaproteobacteria bacterium]
MASKKITDLPQIDDYRAFFLNNTPLLDVRAPIEFKQGAFPFTENIPLMNDAEREAVGIQYKNLGQDEAIKLGHQLVQGEIKSQRVSRWEQFIKQHPQGILYCFRGGMRSKISQQWIYEKTGIIYPRVKGGYKAMRRFLIDELEASTQRIQPVILGGRTGIGKTIFLNKIKQQIDLEGIFHHRGSVFGKHVTPQPTQIEIENTLSIALLKLLHQDHTQIVLEDEGANIGSRRIPECLIKKMKQSPIVMLEASIEERINIIFQEYIIDALEEHQEFYGEEKGFQLWTEQLKAAIDKIQRRLGGVRHKELKALLTHAIEQHTSSNTELHKDWIKVLLVDYYDPMYDYQLSKNQHRVVFKGEQNEVSDYLAIKHQIR